ncbi:pyridoxamine 5'-phosphate oxidase family protein [Paraurantiacibacter namhicola]|nr:pyridoxamine 5'-phosphate oxidase family protein [Paraurantiacibacter namhicola]
MGDEKDTRLAMLAAVREDLDAKLAEAARSSKSPMHTPVVSTADGDARIMVLREYDAASGTLRFHTDIRAPKVEVIQAAPRLGVLAYDREARLQIRLTGTGRIESEGPVADAAWAASDAFARRCYLGAAPGEASEEPDTGLPSWVEGKRPTEEELAPARANFAVLLVQVDRWDWYHLHHMGHRRAIFTGHGDSREGSWVTP